MSKKPFRIRTVTSFITLHPQDFDCDDLNQKIGMCSSMLHELESHLISASYEVQTLRIATNPFGEWLTPYKDSEMNDWQVESLKDKDLSKVQKDAIESKLKQLNNILAKYNINFCSLGSSMNPTDTVSICPLIISIAPGRFSCSANVDACDIHAARAAARCIKDISSLGNSAFDSRAIAGDSNHLVGGLGNFRFCTASQIKTGVPFFPAAKASSIAQNHDENYHIEFAIGLENGEYARQLLMSAKSINKIRSTFSKSWREKLLPIQEICMRYVDEFHHDRKSLTSSCQKMCQIKYLGIDTSLNPSLHNKGSIAHAIESLDEVHGSFGQSGSLAAAAVITTSLQSIPDIIVTGYCGLMLPVLEDHRLAELGKTNLLNIQQLLCICSVCGVGLDTVPIPGDVSEDSLSSLILDVAALAERWSKPLSCRLLPVPDRKQGESTHFDSPYMCNSCIFAID